MQLLAATALLVLFAAVTDRPRTVEAEGRGSATARMEGIAKPVLNGFRLRYTSGDHELRNIAVAYEKGVARGTLADQNSDDEMSMRASYAGWDFYRWNRTQGDCRGTCTIPVVAPPSDLAGTKRLVLVNFDILVKKTGDDPDRRVRVLSIRPSADERSYRIELRDNAAIDYYITLDYAWVSATYSSKVTDTASRSATQRTERVRIGHPSDANQFISGFSVEFKNGEHNFGDLGFEQDADGQYWVRFNDQNYDDPMTATLDRVLARG